MVPGSLLLAGCVPEITQQGPVTRGTVELPRAASTATWLRVTESRGNSRGPAATASVQGAARESPSHTCAHPGACTPLALAPPPGSVPGHGTRR